MSIHQFHAKPLTWLAIGSVVLTVVLALVLPTQHAAAQSGEGPKWAANAMACVPNGSTSQNDLVQTSHGHARYSEGKTGHAYLICPFTDAALHGTVVRWIGMTFRDGTPDGTVTAHLKLIDKRSGEILIPLSVDSNCLVDSSQLGNPYWSCGQSGTEHLLDFDRYYYYVQLSLHRSVPTADIRVVGVSVR